MGNNLVDKTKTSSLKTVVKSAAMELGKALPSHMNPERIVRIALTTINQNPELANCTPASFMGSLFVLAQIGLEPIAGRAYLLPFKNKRKVGDQWKYIPEVQALIGYKGYVDLFYRHESALSVDMQTVYKNDVFDYQYGSDSFLTHKPAPFAERGEAIGYYAIAKLKGGTHLFRYMTREEAMEHGKTHSKTYNKKDGGFSKYSPWSTEPNAMCMKTVLLQLAKLLPLSVELQRAVSIDETSRDYRKGVKDAFDLKPTTNFEDDAPQAIDHKTEGEPQPAADWFEDDGSTEGTG